MCIYYKSPIYQLNGKCYCIGKCCCIKNHNLINNNNNLINNNYYLLNIRNFIKIIKYKVFNFIKLFILKINK